MDNTLDESTEHSAKFNSNSIVKTVPVIRDLSLNPSCSHGPTILFERDGTKFFSCSAYRSRKLCQFYMTEEKWENSQRNNVRNDGGSGSKLKKRCLGEESKDECLLRDSKKLKSEINHPLTVPNQRDKGEAQYHFNEKTVDFLMKQLKGLATDSILCIGTPSLHHHVLTSEKESGHEMSSFLLDIDGRFSKLYKDKFSLYNMCNHHFFQDASEYNKFLMKSKNLAVIVDPPFGVKVELIWHSCLQGVQRDLSCLGKNISGGNLNFEAFWIFPYFMEGHIRKCSESLQMSDFHVEYRNHAKYSGSSSKSRSSPIRIFTTVPLSNLILPKTDYRFCETCTKWVDKRNEHCDICDKCTTKDGGRTYVHCKKCKKCVKPTWKHCIKCASCHFADDTTCKQHNRHDSKHYNVTLNSQKMRSSKDKRNHGKPKKKQKYVTRLKK